MPSSDDQLRGSSAAPRPRAWARRLLATFGWSVDVAFPPGPRCVIIVYPHTSNWDFVVGYLAKLASGLPVHWVGKHTLFRWPVAGLLRRMGGIPVNRGARSGLTERLAAELRARPRMWLAIAPEGTRRRTPGWKSGFYHLALAAEVPVGLAYIDYARKVVGLAHYVELSGDVPRDLALLRATYAGKVGKHPEQAAPITLDRHPPTP